MTNQNQMAKEVLIEALTENGVAEPSPIIDYLVEEIEARADGRLTNAEILVGMAICHDEVTHAVADPDCETGDDVLLACPRLAKGLGFEIEK